MSYLRAIRQDVVADSNNSSTANLNAGATFTGAYASTLGVAGIQVSLKADQNCTVYIDQSPDHSNWDITDTYTYYAAINNFGVTVQAINSYVRVRVTNNGASATTYLRLQTALCPVVEAVPRSLDSNQNLKVAIQSDRDGYGFGAEHTPMGEVRAIAPTRLVGTTFVGAAIDTVFWTAAGTGSGAVTVGNAQASLATGATADSTISLTTTRVARYVGGSSMRFRAVIRQATAGTANNVRRWGAFTTTDGAFFELAGSTLKVVTRKTSNDTAVSSGSFNGVLGSSYTLDTNVKTFEIYWTNSKVYFVVGDEILHTVSATTTTWADTMNFPVRMENNNSGGAVTPVTMNVRVATIYRLGPLVTQPTSYYFALGQTAGTNLKLSAGNLHGIVVNNVTNNSVITLSDSTSAATPVLWAHTAGATSTSAYSLDLKGLPFYTGLRLTVSAANSSVTVIYE